MLSPGHQGLSGDSLNEEEKLNPLCHLSLVTISSLTFCFVPHCVGHNLLLHMTFV